MKAQTNSFARSRAKELRRDATDCERLLCRRLRGGQVGVKFRRQHPFETSILDFVCLEQRVIVELDGSQHYDAVTSDEVRTKLLSDAGFRVLRFWNNEVIDEMDAVLDVMHRSLQTRSSSDGGGTHPLPNPPLEGEGTKPRP